jgi:hypothetical protein
MKFYRPTEFCARKKWYRGKKVCDKVKVVYGSNMYTIRCHITGKLITIRRPSQRPAAPRPRPVWRPHKPVVHRPKPAQRPAAPRPRPVWRPHKPFVHRPRPAQRPAAPRPRPVWRPHKPVVHRPAKPACGCVAVKKPQFVRVVTHCAVCHQKRRRGGFIRKVARRIRRGRRLGVRRQTKIVRRHTRIVRRHSKIVRRSKVVRHYKITYKGKKVFRTKRWCVNHGYVRHVSHGKVYYTHSHTTTQVQTFWKTIFSKRLSSVQNYAQTIKVNKNKFNSVDQSLIARCEKFSF